MFSKSKYLSSVPALSEQLLYQSAITDQCAENTNKQEGLAVSVASIVQDGV